MDLGICSKRQKSNQGQDIISNMPHFIIGEIFSFLPTREAVRSSNYTLLSKRWKNVWTFITKLHFDDSLHYYSTEKFARVPNYANFINLVNRVLFHHNNISIQSFSLAISSYGYNYATKLINSWISSILNRRVRKL